MSKRSTIHVITQGHPWGVSAAAALLLLLLLAAPASAAFDPATYGAVPDDGLSDGPAVAAALADARVAGGTIQLGRGVWEVEAGVLAIDRSGIVVAGEGPGVTTLRLTTDGDGVSFGAAPYFGDCGGLRDLTIDSGPGRVAGRTILVWGCYRGRISNVTILAAGHGLSWVCPAGAGSNCSRWWISDVFIENRGATAAVWIEGGNDQRFSGVHIRGRREVGSRGVLVLETGGFWMSDVDVILEEVGWAFVPPAGRDIFAFTCHNCYGDSSSVWGWNLAGAGTIRGFDCVSCWVGGNGLPANPEFGLPDGAGAASRGFRVMNGDGLTFTNTRVWDTGGTGFEVGPAVTNLELRGGWASANGISAPGTMPGVSIAANGFQVTGLRSGTVIYTGVTQSCGVEIAAGADNFHIVDNDLRGNVTGLCNGAGTGPSRIVRDNLPAAVAVAGSCLRGDCS